MFGDLIYLVIKNWNATLMWKVEYCHGFTLLNHKFEWHYELNWCKTETDLSTDCCMKQKEHVHIWEWMNIIVCQFTLRPYLRATSFPEFLIFPPFGAGEGGTMRDPGSKADVRIHFWYTCHVNDVHVECCWFCCRCHCVRNLMVGIY